jgi:hypothetical protein
MNSELAASENRMKSLSFSLILLASGPLYRPNRLNLICRVTGVRPVKLLNMIVWRATDPRLRRGSLVRRFFDVFHGSIVRITTRFWSLIGCEDTKARQENEQLRAHVAELVKESGDLGNRVDALTQENAALKQENEQLKRKAKTKKTKKSKLRQHTSNGQ